MKEKHLTDQEIQEHALGTPGYASTFTEHLQTCEACSLKVESYKQVFVGIKRQAAAEFDFDLSALVISKIDEKGMAQSSINLFWLWGIAATIPLLLVVYSFGAYLSALFTSVPDMGFYVAASTALVLLIFLGNEIYQKYKRQLNSLDLY